jgi:predicted ATPase/DNA-binding CsgD family transcriptional regulator
MESLQAMFENVATAEGHCALVSGEPGIGKTSLTKTFCSEIKDEASIYQGTCDALFTPRPLAPVYDILWQMNSDLNESTEENVDRTLLFTKIYRVLKESKKTSVVVIEDIHWADEATLDFIKFLARRINQLHCLFILNFRDDEIHVNHPLTTVLGQLPPDSLTRLQLTPLSRGAVEKLATEKGYKGEDVYSISGGNPFYVNEILASYSLGIPANIKDSVLSVYNRLDGISKQVWQILSVLPTGIEVNYLEKMEPFYQAAIHNCLDLKIVIAKNDVIFFKHELYRRTIETSLSPLVRMELNKRILDLFLESFEQKQEIERIIHHAKNANEHELVVKFAPIAARQASAVGAHIEASKLYFSAIEYYQGNDSEMLIDFYESYAYECYLTNQVKEGIIYFTRALNLLREINDMEKIGNSLRFLSRLWWYDGNRVLAEKYAAEAITLLNDMPSSKAKAMAFSNMSQLKLVCDKATECIFWGTKAIEIAKEINDDESLSHALNNVGSIKMNLASSAQEGKDMLQQSLDIALKNCFHEHVARAYSNLASNGVASKDFVLAKKALDAGIQFCEERDLDSWRANMLSSKAVLLLETGDWDQACDIATYLLQLEKQLNSFSIHASLVMAAIKMRRDEEGALELLLDAITVAFETQELQRMIPALITALEYECITGTSIIRPGDLDTVVSRIKESILSMQVSEFAFWLKKVRNIELAVDFVYEGFDLKDVASLQKAAELWRKLGCSYMQGAILFEGNDEQKRTAIGIMDKLGAVANCERMKFEMRASGIKNIPRGIRKTTKLNPANLTDRELDVLRLLKEGYHNKEIATKLFISAKTVDHHLSSIFFKLDVNSRARAVQEALQLEILK